MRATILALFILFTSVLPISSPAQVLCQSVFGVEAQPVYPSRDILDQKLMAVHITDYIPHDGILRTVTESRARFSVTLHFSLGGPVVSHSAGNWTKKKYAVLLPFKYLRPQLLNVFSQDTFIVGDLIIPRDAVLLVPNDEPAPTDFPGQIIKYDSAVGIVQSVKDELVRMNSVTLESTGPQLSDKTFYKGKEIDELYFFKDYFKNQKTLTHELHAETTVGKIDLTLYRLFANWFYRSQPSTATYQELKYKRLVIYELLRVVDQQVRQMSLISPARMSYQNALKNVGGLLRIIDLEIFAQDHYQRSILKVVIPHREEILRRMHDWQSLVDYLKENVPLLPASSPADGGRDDFLLMTEDDLKSLSFERFKLLVENHEKERSMSLDFDHQSLILKKAIEMVNVDRRYLSVVVKQFEKMIPSTPEWGFSRLAAYIYKLPSVSDRQILLKKPEIQQLFISKIGQAKFQILFSGT